MSSTPTMSIWSEILHRLLEWCKALEIPVVLLSATLPPEKKAQMLSAYTDHPIQPAILRLLL